MQTTKTLWMLDYRQGKWSNLVPIYAVDEQEAWRKAHSWAEQHNVLLSEDATLVHFPHGFTIYRRVLPGSVESM